MAKEKIKELSKKAKEATVNTAKEVGKTISSNPVGALYVFGGLLALFVVYKIYKGINSAFSGTTNPAGVNLNLNVSNVTITPETARNLASQLLDAMNRYGTDEDLISAVFDLLKTGDDFKLVVDAFGLQPYNGAGLPPEGLPPALDGATPMNLVGWLSEELSRGDDVYSKVKERFNTAGFVLP